MRCAETKETCDRNEAAMVVSTGPVVTDLEGLGGRRTVSPRRTEQAEGGRRRWKVVTMTVDGSVNVCPATHVRNRTLLIDDV